MTGGDAGRRLDTTVRTGHCNEEMVSLVTNNEWRVIRVKRRREREVGGRGALMALCECYNILYLTPGTPCHDCNHCTIADNQGHSMRSQ